MAEYIEKEAAMLTPVLPKEHRRYQTSNLDDVYEQGWADALDNLKNAPTADVAPVRHGRWDDSGRYTFPSGAVAVRCTNCGCALTESEHRLYNWSYCPVCGAKMDGGDK